MSTTQPSFDDVWRLFQELAIQSKETDRRFQETERFVKETFDRLAEERAAQSRETDRKIKEVSASIGRLGNRLGDFVEDAVRPSAVRLFRERGVDVHEVQQNVSAQRGGEGLEVDLLVVNDTEVVAIECKSHLKQDDVDEHLVRLAKLKRLLPRYANCKVMGALAAMSIPDNVAAYAFRRGLFVIGQSGEDLAIRNAPGFEPAAW